MLLDIYPKQKTKRFEKYKTSDNPSRVHSKESGDQEPADALRFDAAEPLHPLRHCEAPIVSSFKFLK